MLGILVCLAAEVHGELYLPHCHPVCPRNANHPFCGCLLLVSFLLKQMKQNSLLQAGHFMCLQASVCSTSAPQWGHALSEGVFTPAMLFSRQLSNIVTRGSLPPTVRITANTVEPWCIPRD